MNKIVNIVIFLILSIAIIILVLDKKKANDGVTTYKEQIKSLNAKNDSLIKVQDSLEYQIAEIHLQINNLSSTNDLLFTQYKNAKDEIERLKNQRIKIDSSIYNLNCQQLSDILTKRYQ